MDYAAVVALELSQTGTDEPVVTMRFKNGTTDPEFHTLSLLNTTTGLPLSQFVGNLSVRLFAISCIFQSKCLRGNTVRRYQHDAGVVRGVQPDEPARVLCLLPAIPANLKGLGDAVLCSDEVLE